MNKSSLDKKIDKILREEETFLLSLILLAHMHEDDKYKNLSELVFLFDNYKGFKQFIKYYGGTTIQVPSVRELKQSLRLLELFQRVKIDGKDFNECYQALKLSSLDLNPIYCQSEIERFNKYLKTEGSDVLNQIKKLSKRW